MVVQDANRYSAFREGELELPETPPPEDPTKNPFLNQIADNPLPWQSVKKRGDPPAPAVAAPPRTLIIKDRPKLLPRRDANSQQRTRSDSSPTIASDRPFDPRENWCGVCNFKFATKIALQSHVKQAPDRDHANYCNLCVRVFKDRNGLKNHVDNTRGHGIFCNLCLSAFKDEWGLKNHFENNYHVDHRFACLTCLLGFNSQAELNRHLKTTRRHTWCMTCKRPFRSQEERDQHWRLTTVHKHCLQPGCDFDGPNSEALEAHLEHDHFRCDGCKLIFPSQTKLFRHQEDCNLPVSCPNCGELCAGQGGLARHLQQCFACEVCEFYTPHEIDLRIHMSKHTAATIPCWACGLFMRTFSMLIKHLESGKCTRFHDPSLLVQALGEWWYSPLYMDLDIHAQIRTKRVSSKEVNEWMGNGVLMPFLCREEGCSMSFGHLSELARHLEGEACAWGLQRLNAAGLEALFREKCVEREGGE